MPWTTTSFGDAQITAGIAVVSEEVGLRTPTVEHVAPDLVEIGGRDPGPDRGADPVVHLGDDPARLAHHGDLGRLLAHTHDVRRRPVDARGPHR